MIILRALAAAAIVFAIIVASVVAGVAVVRLAASLACQAPRC